MIKKYIVNLTEKINSRIEYIKFKYTTEIIVLVAICEFLLISSIFLIIHFF